jgi:hypothetical protein
VALTQPVAVARRQGKLPQCLGRLVNETLQAAVPWQGAPQLLP